jgi:hypothetical protein
VTATEARRQKSKAKSSRNSFHVGRQNTNQRQEQVKQPEPERKKPCLAFAKQGFLN